jgi:hypothetical protein
MCPDFDKEKCRLSGDLFGIHRQKPALSMLDGSG